jgi:hypothetical protein
MGGGLGCGLDLGFCAALRPFQLLLEMAMKMPSTRWLVSTSLFGHFVELGARTVGSGLSWPSMVPVFRPR